MKVAIRADASAALGLGHLKRCLSLAQALRAQGAAVEFFFRRIDLDALALIASQGFAGHTLGAGAVVQEQDDARDFIPAARRFEPETVLVDHYALGADWHGSVRTELGTRLVAIDDLGNRAMAVDLLVDPNLAADPQAKHCAHLPASARLLCGPQHALLAPTYARAPRHTHRPCVRSIGIFMGGTDSGDLSSLALRALREHVDFTGAVEIATTSGNPNLPALRRRVETELATTLTLDQNDLAAFFARHDLHVGAGGGATWERCCIGAPTLAVLAAPNQLPVLLPLQPLGVARVLTADPPTTHHLAHALPELIADAALRRSLSLRAQGLVDGLGAQRVAQRMLQP